MEKKKLNFWGLMKSLLLSPKFKDLLSNLIIRTLKLQMLGGFRGWLIKTLVGEFSDEVVDVVVTTFDYVELKKDALETRDNEDRNEATDNLNDLMR